MNTKINSNRQRYLCRCIFVVDHCFLFEKFQVKLLFQARLAFQARFKSNVLPLHEHVELLNDLEWLYIS